MEASASSSSSSRQIVIGNAFEGLAPQQHSSFPTHICDVFINHRGPDVKMTLASTIYHTLQTMNLRAFLDVEELELGDFLPNKIQDAMRTASLHIAIFSPRYAESPWCLAELSFMLKTDAKIIPVFYEVKPSDLRYIKKGMYSEAFAQHERKGRYGADKLDEWKAALYNVSFRTGFELNKPDGDQGKLLKSIVNSVLKAVKKAPLEVAKHPVGLSEMVEIFQKRMLERMQDNESVKIVGIVGMGGSGKTTLAKELYNQECHSFKGSSFVFNVREASANKALHTLQSKLLKDLVHIECPIYHVDEGKEILRNRLRFSRVLIILDDVDNVDQIDALLVKDVLGAGSVIVVTSRDKGVLQRSGISFFHELKGLDEKYARELFCWHAFLHPTPLNRFEDLVEDFLSACGRLPLSLKVVGGLLYGERNPVIWQGQLQKIKKILPQDIMRILRVSYDALDMEEKQIFLDIACFFVGENKSLAIRVWDASEWSGFCSLQTLEQKCLVDVDQDDRLQLHDHLRDMGRKIADEGFLNSTIPLRLWHSKQIANTLHRRPGRVEVRGIMAVTRGSRHWQATSCYQPPFEEMLRENFGCPSAIGLQLLVIKNNDLNSKFSELSSNLVWLRWYDFPETILPSWFSLKTLRVLELIGGKSEELWQCEDQAPSELRELEIWGSRFCKFPKSIGMLIHLEKIVLTGLELDGYIEQQNCSPVVFTGFRLGRYIEQQNNSPKHNSRLQSLPEEFCYLQSLKHLELRLCESLISLPRRLGSLTNLRHLSHFGCRSLGMLPDNFGRLTQLQFLDLAGCENLVIQPENFGKISSIEHLSLSNCKSLLSLPNQITCQTYLTRLCLVGTSLGYLPDDLGNLHNLTYLAIGSPFLTSLPLSLGNLTSLTQLKLVQCDKLECIPESLGKLNLLRSLSIESSGIEYLPKALGQLINLETLDVTSCPIRDLCFTESVVVEEIADMEEPALSANSESNKMYNLKSIYLSGTKICKVSIPENDCPNLERLYLSCNVYLTEVGALPTTLVSLILWQCKTLKKIEGISDLANLRSLVLYGCEELNDLTVAHMKSLESIDCDLCWKLQRIDGLKQLDRLADFSISSDTRTIWNCIHSLQIFPCVTKWSGRAVHDVESIVNTLTFDPDLTVVDKMEETWYGNVMQMPLMEMNFSNAVILICHFTSTSTEKEIQVKFCQLSEISWRSVRVKEGEWVSFVIITEKYEEWEYLKRIRTAMDAVVFRNESEFVVRKMWMVMVGGEEGKIIEVMKKLATIFQ